MLRSFIEGMEIESPSGEAVAITEDVLQAALGVREAPDDSDIGHRIRANAERVAAAVEARIDRYVNAGGNARSVDWDALTDTEQLLLLEAVTRFRNRERSLLAFQVCQGMGSPAAYEALTEDDPQLASVKTRAKTWQQAVAAIAEIGGGVQ